MPRDPKRNIQNYQLKGGHLNEFEFQKNQSKLAEESELPFSDEINKPDLASPTKHIAEVTAEAHRIVEKRKKRGDAKTGTRQRVASGGRPAKKVARKSAKKTTTRAGMKRRTNVKGRHQKTGANR